MSQEENAVLEFVQPEGGERYMRIELGVMVLRLYVNNKKESLRQPTHNLYWERPGGLHKVTGLWSKASAKNGRHYVVVKLGFAVLVINTWREGGVDRIDWFTSPSRSE